MSANEITISIDEFNKLQKSVLEYKQQSYNAEEQLKKLQQQKSTGGASNWFNKGPDKDKERLQQENQQLKQANQQLKEEFNEQSAAIKDNLRVLHAENETLQQKVKDLEAKAGQGVNTTTAAATADQSALIEDYKQQLTSKEQAFTILQQQLEDALRTKRDQEAKHQQEMEALQKQLEQKNHDVDKLQSERAQQTEQMRGLQDLLRQSNVDSQEKINHLQEENSQLLLKNAAIQAELEESREEVLDLARSKAEIVALTEPAAVEASSSDEQLAELQNAHKKELEEKEAAWQREILEKNTLIESLQQQQLQLQQQNAVSLDESTETVNLDASTAGNSLLLERYDAANQRITELEKQLEEAKNNAYLNSTIRDDNFDEDEWKVKLEELQIKSDAQQENIQSLLQQLDEQKNISNEYKEKLEHASKQHEENNTIWQQKLDDVQSQLQAKQEEIQTLLQRENEQNEEEEEKKENVNVVEQENEWKTKYEAAQEQVTTLLADVAALNEQLERQKETLAATQSNLEQLQTQITTNEQQHRDAIQALEEKNATLQTDLQKAQNDCKQLTEDLITQSERFGKQSETTKTQLQQAEQHNKESAEQIALLEEKLQQTKETLQTQITKLKQEATNTKEELLLTQEDRQIIMAKLTDSNLDLDRLRDELAMAREQLRRDQSEFAERLEQEKALTAKTLQKQLDDANSHKQVWLKEKNILQKKLTELEKTQEASMSNEEHLSLQTKKLEQLRSTVVELTSALEQHDEQLQTERDRYTTLQQETDQLKLSLTALQEKYSRVGNELNAMSIRKEEVVTRNREAMDDLKKTHSEATLKLTLQLDQVSQQLEQEQVKTGELEEALTQATIVRDRAVSQLDSVTNELQQIRDEHQQLLQSFNELEAKYHAVKSSADQSESTIQQLKQDLIDAGLKNDIELKKSKRLIKDLQTQLQKARSHDHVGTPNIPVSAPPSVSADAQVATGSGNNMPPALAKASSSATVAASPARKPVVRLASDLQRRPSQQQIAAPSVAQDMEAVALKIGELQKRNFLLEEHIKKLQGKMQLYRQEIEKKNKLIQHHLVNLSVEGRSTAEMDAHKKQRAVKETGIMSRFFGGQSNPADSQLQSEINSKMTSVLEDTLLKNVQLQSDMEIMGNEIMKLEKELNELKNASKSSA